MGDSTTNGRLMQSWSNAKEGLSNNCINDNQTALVSAQYFIVSIYCNIIGYVKKAHNWSYDVLTLSEHFLSIQVV